jgi:predicted transcriptional regulator
MEDVADAQGKICSVILKFAGKPDPKPTKLEQAKDLILAILEAESRSRKDILAILESKNIEERTASQALRDLAKEELIVATKSGKENQYSLPPTEANTDSDTS